MLRLIALALLVTSAAPAALSAQVDKIYGGPAALPPRLAEAFVDTMAATLRNLVVSQEAYFSDNNHYSKRFAYGQQKGAEIQPPPGVTLTITYATAAGWAGRATHELLPGLSCVIEVGKLPPSRQLRTTGGREAADEGRPTCDRP